MKARIKHRALRYVAIALMAVICFVTVLYSASFISPVTLSADDAMVANISAQGVNVYISGDGVTRDENGNYVVPKNIQAEITVVNDAAISSGISVTTSAGTTDAASPNHVTVDTGNGELNIDVTTSGLATARGTSLSTAYQISDDSDLMALSKILASRDDDPSTDVEGDGDITDATKATFASYLNEFGLADESWLDDEGNLNEGVTAGTVSGAVSSARTALSTAYFVLADDVMLNSSNDKSADYSSGYFGLGSRRGVPFQGVFDFNGHAVTLNLSLTETSKANFSTANYKSGQGNAQILSVGFFNYIYGDGEHACAIIGGDVRGTIAASADLKNADKNVDYLLFAGGLAGTIGDKVVLDGASSATSVSILTGTGGNNTEAVSVYAGGLFGLSGADIDYWSNVSYTGNYSEISITSDSGSGDDRCIAGVLAGVVQNSYINGFHADLRGANILADSTGRGNAITGGLAGIIYSGTPQFTEISVSKAVSIRGINISASGSTLSSIVTSRVNNNNNFDEIEADDVFGESFSRNADIAISGGLMGLAYTDGTESNSSTLNISDVSFLESGANGGFTVHAATSDSSSLGIPFAGGLVGYVQADGQFVNFSPVAGDQSESFTLFGCDVTVNSVQNGAGPAYAGGVFGYNAFTLPSGYTFNLTDEKSSIDVIAEQTETAGNEMVAAMVAAGSAKPTVHGVFAGFYTSVLQTGYEISDFTFNVNDGHLEARRLAGSEATGDISAGAVAGWAEGTSNGDSTISGLNVTLTDCSVNALGYSFDSDLGAQEYNNVYAGGIFGYVANYGSYSGSGTGTLGISNISLVFRHIYGAEQYSVRGIQNAQAANKDYMGEGYVGGMFGMMSSCNAQNLTLDGNSSGDTLIYFNSTNNPNTASVGGLIGATRITVNPSNGNRLYRAQVKNVHVAGRAYFDGVVPAGLQSYQFEINVGGAVGVFGSANGSANAIAEYIYVENSAVESIGEEYMLAYAGGVFGGSWYAGTLSASHCYSINNSVLASSASNYAFAAGFSGLLQSQTTSNCGVIDTTVEAITYGSYAAYSAGISARLYGTATVSNCFSNAVVTAMASGNTSTYIAGLAIKDNIANNGGDKQNVNNSFFIAANVQSQSNGVYINSGNNIRQYNNYAVALTGTTGNNPARGMGISHTFYNDYDWINVYGFGSAGGHDTEINIVGTSVSLNNNTVVRPVSDRSGTSYVQLHVKIPAYVDNSKNKDYLLCAYPVYVGEATKSSGITITTPDFTNTSGKNQFVNSGNAKNYYTEQGSTYVDFTIVSEGFTLNGENGENFAGSIFTLIGGDDSAIRDDNGKTMHLYYTGGVKIDKGDEGNIINVTRATTFAIKDKATLIIAAARNIDDDPIDFVLLKQNENDFIEYIKPYNGSWVLNGTSAYKFNADNSGGLFEFKEINGVEYIEDDDLQLVTYTFNDLEEGTYYFGSGSNGYRIFALDIQYADQNNHYRESDTYFQIYTGDSESVQNVIINNLNVYMPNVYLVQNTTANPNLLLGYNDNGTSVDGGDKNSRPISDRKDAMDAIIGAKGNALTLPGVKDYFNITASADGMQLNISPVLGNTDGAALVLEYEAENGEYFYVVIEAVPNAITSIDVRPAEDTPPRAITTVDNEIRYVYSNDDTVRLEAVVYYRFGFNRYIVDVEFSRNEDSTEQIRNPNGEYNYTVQVNGTVDINSCSDGNTIIVDCTPVVSGLAISNTMSASIILEVATSITVTPENMSGASYSPVNDNNAVVGHEFSFTLTPNPGYGLNPTLNLTFLNGNNTIGSITNIVFPEKRQNGVLGQTSAGNSGQSGYEFSYSIGGSTSTGNKETYTSAIVDGQTVFTYTLPIEYYDTTFNITYTFNPTTGVYTITLPAEMFEMSDLSEVRISASFDKVYSVMFDLGDWVEYSQDSGGVGSRFFIYQVKQGEQINTELREEIFEYFDIAYSNAFTSSIENRAGFTFKGFYATDSASSLASYGTSFVDYCAQGNDTIRGSLNYYARWNYTAKVFAPQGVSVRSALGSQLIETVVSDGSGSNLIPIDTAHGFSFTIQGNYIGIPRVELFTAVQDGETVAYEKLTFTQSGNVYTVTGEIKGTVYIYIYADNISSAVGETDVSSAFGEAIDLNEDGIFTVRYAVNHGDESGALGGGATFTFSQTLPEGTDLRLFYQVNGVPVSVGRIPVGAGGITSVKASDFDALTGAPADTDGNMSFAYTGTVVSEVYYLVITLPNNEANFGAANATGGYVSFMVTVNEYSAALVETDYITPAVSVSGTTGQSQSALQNVEQRAESEISTTANLYSAVIRNIEYNGNTVTYSVTGGNNVVTDVRHANSYYVLRVEGEVTVSGYTTVHTDVATYIILPTVSSNSSNITITGLKGTVQLLEVTNMQYPSAGTVIDDEFTI